MKSRRIIEQFIELKALDKSYDSIVEKIGVSKPTLIKWGKQYKDEIKKVKILLTTKIAEKIVKKNEELLNSIAENLKRAVLNKTALEETKEKFVKKSYKRLGDIFNVKIKNIELTINSDGDVSLVYIECE